MRRNLYGRSEIGIVQALKSLGWFEATPKRSGSREFHKNKLHLILERHKSLGCYVILHKDTFLPQSYIHTRPIKRGSELQSEFLKLMEEYKRLHTSKTCDVRQ